MLLTGISASTVFLVALALFASNPAATIVLTFLLGVSAFYTAPALNARMFNVAGAAPTLAGATTTAAFNLGNTGGPWLGGTVIDANLGFASTAWAGAAMTVLGLGTAALALRLTKRPAPGHVVARSTPAGGTTPSEPARGKATSSC